MVPSPHGPIPNDASAHRLIWHPAGFCDLREGLAEVRLRVPLRPTQPMDDPLPIYLKRAKALSLALSGCVGTEAPQA
jgi:hypothetical protein